MKIAFAFGCGALFAIGLGISGMTDPRNVLAFLDIFGDWSPALMAVMVSAIAVNAAAVAIGTRWGRPLAGDAFHPPPRSPIDPRLLVGASLFGVGWGLSGYCPGPALVSLVSPNAGLIAFLAAVVVGMLLHDRAWAR